ncbi:MAG: GGDEF domain-containing protein [Pseudomonadota bacterium]
MLTTTILVIFGGVFAGVYLYHRQLEYIGWLSLAYAAALAAFFSDINRNSFPSSASADLAANTFFWLISIAILLAFTARAKTTMPWGQVLILVVIGYFGQFWFIYGYADIIARSLASDTIGAALIAIILPILWRNRVTRVDHTIFWMLAIISLVWFIRPFIVYFVLGETHSHESYTTSSYALVLHITSAVAALAGAVIMLITVGYDMIVEYQRANTTDSLTGALNRRGYDELLENEGAADYPGNVGRAVIIFDLDRFKQVNDDYGHAVGDAVLSRVGQTARNLIEHHGILARIGGEEFAVILHKTSSGVRDEIAEHLRLSLSLVIHPELPHPSTVTASLGTALIQQGESLKRAIRRADIALYSAKDGGRNCVVHADPVEPARKTISAVA